MKKVLLSTMMLVLALVTSAAGYTVDFNTTIDTKNSAFKVAPGWGHKVGTGSYASQVMPYTYVVDGGVDGSGCLKAGSQQYYDLFDEEYAQYNDMLVTPAVGGTVKIEVKKASTDGNIKFYVLTKNGDTYTQGAEISYEDPGLVSFDYTEIDLASIPEGTLIGIRAENVFIDNFSAEKANVVLSKGLTLSTVTPVVNTQNLDCDENNEFEVKAKVKVKNTGEVDLAAGDAGYNLQIAVMKTAGSQVVVDTVYTTQAITTPLAVGAESDEIEVSAKIKYSDVKPAEGSDDLARRYDVIEGVTGTNKLIRNYTPVPYAPVARITNDDLQVVENNGTVDFGKVNATTTKVLTLNNDGAAPMNVKTITVEGEGFATTAASSLTLAKHTSARIPVELQVNSLGTKTGKLTITAEGIDPVVINLQGEVLDPNAWYVNFEDSKMPANMLNLGNWTVSNKLAVDPNKYYAENTNVEGQKLVSPLLTVAEGDVLTFEAARNYGDVSFVNVYYSTDRTNWTQVRALSINATDEADKLSEEYYGTKWGSNTKYLFTPFTINNIPAGDVYVAFESGNARIDNILGYKVAAVAHDLYVTSFKHPASCMANNTLTATAKVKNLTANAEAAGSYTVKLYLGDEVVAEAESVVLAAGSEATFNFECIPHTLGTFAANVVLEGDGFVVKSATDSIKINEESTTKDVKIGEANADDVSHGATAPLALYYKKTDSESIYRKADFELAAGTKITRIKFHGRGSNNKTITGTLQVYLQNTEDESPVGVFLDNASAAPAKSPAQVAAMTEVYNGSYTYVSKTAGSDIIDIELATPFEYTGQNLRVALKSESSSWATVFFETDSTKAGQSVFRGNDNTLPSTNSASNLPVMYLNVTAEAATLTGVVTDANQQPIAGAKISLSANNDSIQYSGVTDADGKYSISVVQNSYDFNVTAEAEGYETFTTTQSFPEGQSAVLDIVMNEQVPTGVTDVTATPAEDTNAPIYDVMGRQLSAKPESGFYIQNGKKHYVK